MCLMVDFQQTCSKIKLPVYKNPHVIHLRMLMFTKVVYRKIYIHV